MRRDAGISLHLRFSHSCFFTVCADFNVLFLRQFSSDFCNSRFILKRNVFPTEVHCQIYIYIYIFFFLSKCIFLCTFLGKMKKKQEKCIILMYCLYERQSINEHNADITFFCTCVSYILRPKPKESVKN